MSSHGATLVKCSNRSQGFPILRNPILRNPILRNLLLPQIEFSFSYIHTQFHYLIYTSAPANVGDYTFTSPPEWCSDNWSL